MITATSLCHPLLLVRIDAAMREATRKSREFGVGIAHASGIEVAHVRCLNRSEFTFYDSHDNNITRTVISALREHEARTHLGTSAVERDKVPNHV
jgi:hypothetical protein